VTELVDSIGKRTCCKALRNSALAGGGTAKAGPGDRARRGKPNVKDEGCDNWTSAEAACLGPSEYDVEAGDVANAATIDLGLGAKTIDLGLAARPSRLPGDKAPEISSVLEGNIGLPGRV